MPLTSVPEDAASAFAAELKRATSGDGITFLERMTPMGVSEPKVTMRLAITAPSINRLLTDPSHTLLVQGSIDVSGVVDAAFTSGTLSLFPDAGGEAMRYKLSFHDDTGSPWTLTGTETITNRTPWRLLRDLTHLTAIIEPGHVSVPAVTARIRLSIGDLTRMVSGIRGIGSTRARRLRASARFSAFFVNSAIRRRSV